MTVPSVGTGGETISGWMMNDVTGPARPVVRGLGGSERLRGAMFALCAVALLAVSLIPAAIAGADPEVTVNAGVVVVTPEGDSGSTVWQVPVTLSAAAAEEVTIDWSTLPVSLSGFAESGTDYVAASGTLTFAPGDTSANAVIEVLGDTADEAPFFGGEWGIIELTNPSANAAVGAGAFYGFGVFVIVDDDPTPLLTPGAASVAEGDLGLTTVDVPVTLSNPSGSEVTVDWETADLLSNPMVAIGGVDYVADSGTLTFPVGSTAETVSIDVIGDTLVEAPLLDGEWGLIRFSNAANATIDPTFFGIGVFNILDDDGVNQPPTITPSSYSTIGNVQLRVDDNPGGSVATPSSPFIEATPDQPLADNTDVDSVLTAQAATIGTANGGTAAINTDGTFLYTPPVGFEGNDTFVYSVLEDGVDNGAIETVTVAVEDVVWFVDSASGPGTGGSQAPLPDLSTLDGVGGADDPGDIIFVYNGNSGVTPLAGGIELENSQQLLGESVGLSLTDANNATQSITVAAGTQPRLTNAAGNGIDLADDNVVRGLTITGALVDGVSAVNANNASLDTITIDAPGRHGVFGTGVDSFSLTSSSITNQGDANEENAIDFSTPGATNLTGVATFDNLMVTNFEDIGIDIGNTSGSLSLAVTASTFTNNDDVNGGEAIAVESSGSATFDVEVTDTTFDNIESDVVALRMLGTGGTHDVNILDNTSTNGGGPDDFPAGGGISLVLANGADMAFDIQGNTLTDAIQGIRVSGVGDAEGRIGGPLLSDGNTITLRADLGAGAGDAIELDMGGSTATPSTGNQSWIILIQNNDLGGDPGSPTFGSDGIGVLHRDSNGTMNVTIEDNTIHDIDDQAIDIFSDEDSAAAIAPITNVRVVDNDFIGLADDAIEVDTDETAQVCLHAAGNDNGGGGSPGTFDLDQRNEPFTVLEVTQVSIAAVSAANTGATVLPTGTITFNGGCTNPTLPSNG